MNLKEIKEMINLMNEHDLVELEMERDGLKIRLKKSSEGELIQKIEKIAPRSEETPPPAEARPEVEVAKVVEIKAPMVGTFYLAPTPESEPFVNVGDVIEEDRTICIIEAMKLMNEIKSEVNGKILEILVENGEPVEFDQSLFKVELQS